MYLSDLHNPAAGGLGTRACNPRREKGREETEPRPRGSESRAGAGARGRHGWRLRSATLKSGCRGRPGTGGREAGAMAERGLRGGARPGRLA